MNLTEFNNKRLEKLKLKADAIKIELAERNVDPRIVLTYSEIKEIIRENNIHLLFACQYLGSNIDFIDLDGDGQSPMTTAVINNNLDFLKELIKCGANASLADPITGKNLLMLAIQSKSDSMMIDYLLDLNVFDFNDVDSAGQNILHYTTRFSIYSVFEKISNLAPDINSVSNFNKSALMMSCDIGKIHLSDIVTEDYKKTKKLIELGVDINLVDIHGYTALMYALSGMRSAASNLLIDAGADLSPESKEDRSTAYMIAERRGLKELADKIYLKTINNSIDLSNHSSNIRIRNRVI